jgi:hypothetical protein
LIVILAANLAPRAVKLALQLAANSVLVHFLGLAFVPLLSLHLLFLEFVQIVVEALASTAIVRCPWFQPVMKRRISVYIHWMGNVMQETRIFLAVSSLTAWIVVLACNTMSHASPALGLDACLAQHLLVRIIIASQLKAQMLMIMLASIYMVSM